MLKSALEKFIQKKCRPKQKQLLFFSLLLLKEEKLFRLKKYVFIVLLEIIIVSKSYSFLKFFESF